VHTVGLKTGAEKNVKRSRMERQHDAFMESYKNEDD
jgi:hypothetical protein